MTEDYDAEALEEIGEVEFEGLPAYKKSHSCPKEGRMVKAASYNELNQKLFTAINSNRESLTKDKFGRPYPKSSLHTRNRNSHADFNKSR